MARLLPNSTLPFFEIQDIDGKKWSNTALGSGKTWLAFFRYASCPICNFQYGQMLKRAEVYAEKEVQIVGVFESPASSIHTYQKTEERAFPLIPDPESRLYDIFGLETSLFGMVSGMLSSNAVKGVLQNPGYLLGHRDGVHTRLPADFLIKDGVIVHAFYASSMDEHIDFATVDHFLGV